MKEKNYLRNILSVFEPNSTTKTDIFISFLKINKIQMSWTISIMYILILKHLKKKIHPTIFVIRRLI